MSPAEQRAIARLKLESQGVDLAQLNFERLDEIKRNIERGESATKGQTVGEALLPAAGATIGALGLGAAPFTGGASLGLTALGAALGGAGGELLRQKTTGQTDDGVDIGNLFEEGALSGGLTLAGAGVGRALGAARGGTAAKATGKLATAGGRTTSKGIKGRLSDAGVRRFFNLRESNVRGITQAGKNPLEIGRNTISKLGLGVDDYDDAIGLVDELGQGGKIGAQLGTNSNKIRAAVRGRKLSLKDFYDDLAKKSKTLRKIPGNERKADFLDDIVASKPSGIRIDGEDAYDLKIALDERFGQAIATGDDLSATVNDVQKAFGNALRKQLKTSDEVAKLLGENQDLIMSRELLKSARNSLEIAGQRGILQSLSPQGALSAIARRPTVARSLGRLGTEGSAQTGGTVAGLRSLLASPQGAQAAAQFVPRLASQAITSGEARTPEELLSLVDDEFETLEAEGAGGFQGFGQAQPQTALGGFLLDPQVIGALIQEDFLQTGGENFGQLTKLLSVSETLQGLQPQTGGAELSSDQQKNLQKIGGVETQFDELLSAFEASGGGEGLKGAFERNILTKVPGLASEERVFEGLRSALIAPLARAISGEVGVLTDRDIKRAEGLLPKLSDTSSEANDRIRRLKSLIQAQRENILSTPGAQNSEQENLANALASIGGI